MKWGIQKERFSKNRALNKASRAKDKASPPKFTAPKKHRPHIRRSIEVILIKLEKILEQVKLITIMQKLNLSIRKTKLKLGQEKQEKF